jgi:hypothetical protein
MISASQSQRCLFLDAGLRQVRVEAERSATGATIHTLRNYVLTIQAALRLIDARHEQGPSEQIEMLLGLTERRLQECRSLLARTRQQHVARRRGIIIEPA